MQTMPLYRLIYLWSLAAGFAVLAMTLFATTLIATLN
jgi:hypothetical protein